MYSWPGRGGVCWRGAELSFGGGVDDDAAGQTHAVREAAGHERAAG